MFNTFKTQGTLLTHWNAIATTLKSFQSKWQRWYHDNPKTMLMLTRIGTAIGLALFITSLLLLTVGSGGALAAALFFIGPLIAVTTTFARRVIQFLHAEAREHAIATRPNSSLAIIKKITQCDTPHVTLTANMPSKLSVSYWPQKKNQKIMHLACYLLAKFIRTSASHVSQVSTRAINHGANGSTMHNNAPNKANCAP